MPLQAKCHFGSSVSSTFLHLVHIVVHAHDDALGIEQKGGGNRMDIELPGNAAVEILGFPCCGRARSCRPAEWPGCQGAASCFDADAEQFQSPGMVAVVQLHQLRIFGPAGTAPTAPELQ